MSKEDKKINKKLKLFVVRKYIWAESASLAILKDKKHPVEDVWVDDEYKKSSSYQKDSAIGFYAPDNE